MPRLIQLTVFLFMLPAYAGQMEVYQCEDERGRMALSDRPCEHLDPAFEFVNMREIETYGSPPSVSALAEPGAKEKDRPRPPRVKSSVALPAPDPGCVSNNPDDPWLNRIGKDDCKKD